MSKWLNFLIIVNAIVATLHAVDSEWVGFSLSMTAVFGFSYVKLISREAEHEQVG
jgi:hypothetical protein